MASDPESGPRVTGRHAAPRLTVRGRLRLPVGRAIALTAVPTALLMGTIAPRFALAADATSSSASATSHDQATGADATPSGSSCTKTSISSLIAGTAKTGTGTATSSRTASATTGGTSAGGKSTSGKSTGTAPTKSSADPAVPDSHPTADPTTAPSSAKPSQAPTSAPAAPASGSSSSTSGNSLLGGVGSILNGLGGLLSLDAEPASATAPTASATPAASAHTASAAPVTRRAEIATPVSVAPSASATQTRTHSTPAASATPSAGPSRSTHPPVGPSTGSSTPAAASPATPTTAAEANRACDVSRLAAPLDTSIAPGEMPAVPWTLKSSSLELINSQFWGVVTVPTAAGDVRVLKFTAQEVNIGDLDMSTQQIGQELHVQGGPGTTSTMRGGTVTMYVTSLSGTLAAAEGIPLAWLGVNLTLTPDTLPQWLYDLIGSVPIPLTLTLNNAVATQTGQFGGNLTIPGMHLFYTPLS